MRGPAVARGPCVCLFSVLAISVTRAQGSLNPPENKNTSPPAAPANPVMPAGGPNVSLHTPLTEEKAVRIGLDRNPRAAAAQAGFAAAASNLRALAAFPNLDLTVTRSQGTS